MHHTTVLITLNLVHKQLICHMCHMPHNIYSITQCSSHRESTETISGFPGSHRKATYAKSLGKICYIAGVRNKRPTGQTWPATSLKTARKRFAECSQCFSRLYEALSAAIVNWQHDAVQKYVFIYK